MTDDDGPGWTTSALAGLIALLLSVENLEQAQQHLAGTLADPHHFSPRGGVLRQEAVTPRSFGPM